MKLKTLVAILLAASLLITCQACVSSAPPSSAPSPADPTEDDFYPDDLQYQEEPDLVDFSHLSISFNGNEINSAFLEFYYSIAENNFINAYYYQLDEIGLSFDLPFSEQECAFNPEMSWFDYFFQGGASNLHSEYAMCLDARENGLSLTEEQEYEVQSFIQDNLSAYSGDLDELNKQIKAVFGANMNLDLFEEQFRVNLIVNNWNAEFEKTLDFTEEELRANFTDEEFEEYNYNMVNVRHILIPEEEGAADLLEEWKADPTEENFAMLASMYTEDTGSAETGGLYENITKGVMVPEFEEWCFDESRKPGDTGIVATDYGFHIMYFSSVGELLWRDEALYVMKSSLVQEKISTLMDKYPLSIS